jgi:hypothetical protein
VLSLARAFFAGGAGTVVATRWPLRDDDAAFVMERFYTSLATGATVGASMRQARRDALAAGLPVEAWAGFALLGDGAGRLVTRDMSQPLNRWWLVAAAAIACAGWRARRVRRHHADRRRARLEPEPDRGARTA